MTEPSARGPEAVPERANIAAEHRWDLVHIFDSPEAWHAELGRVEGLLERISARMGTIGEGPAALAEVLRLESEIGEALDRVYVYAHLLRDQDTRDTGAQAKAERASRLGTRVAEATSWIEPEILALPEERLREWIASPELADRRHGFEDLVRTKAHTLSPREEEILAMAGEVTRTPRTVFGLLNDADLEFRSRQVDLIAG